MLRPRSTLRRSRRSIPLATRFPTRARGRRSSWRAPANYPKDRSIPRDVVRRGDTSPDAIVAKARFVLGLMAARLHGLGASWDAVTVTNIYTVHDLNALLAAEVLPRIGSAAATVSYGITRARPLSESSTKWTCADAREKR